MTTRVKICGLKTEATLDAALEGGADFVGFNFFPPSPRSLSPDVASGLAARARGRARTVAVLVDPDDAMLDRLVRDMRPDLFQLHGHETVARVAEIGQRTARPIIKAVAVETGEQVESALAYKDVAELVLFDAKAPPSLADALPGGNGLAFDWCLLEGVSERLNYLLSGGLTARNVPEAIRLTRAFALDVSSGVETAPGEKSADLIRQFLAAARRASVTA